MSPDQVDKYLRYEDGKFFWIKKKSCKTVVGRRAGHRRPDGYRKIGFAGKSYFEHRLAWFFHYGEWPNGEIDHIDRVRDNNRIENLRLATRSQNACNTDGNKGSAVGLKGVSLSYVPQKPYRASICYEGKTKHLGCFEDEHSAHQAYLESCKELHGEFAYAR